MAILVSIALLFDVLLAILLLVILREVVLLKHNSLPYGSTSPTAGLQKLQSNKAVDSEVLARVPKARDEAVIVFLSSQCGPCYQVLAQIAENGDIGLPLYGVITDGVPDSGLSKEFPGWMELIDREDAVAVADAFIEPGTGTPFTVYIRDSRVKTWLSGARWPVFVDQVSKSRSDGVPIALSERSEREDASR